MEKGDICENHMQEERRQDAGAVPAFIWFLTKQCGGSSQQTRSSIKHVGTWPDQRRAVHQCDGAVCTCPRRSSLSCGDMRPRWQPTGDHKITRPFPRTPAVHLNQIAIKQSLSAVQKAFTLTLGHQHALRHRAVTEHVQNKQQQHTRPRKQRGVSAPVQQTLLPSDKNNE